MPNQNKWDDHWLNIASVWAKLSKDPSTKVGGVIVTPDNRQSSAGYNGLPRGVKETPDKWERPTKYEWVIHAELNAVMNCPFDTYGCSVYTTITPCHKCMEHMRNAGIQRVIYAEEYERLTHKDIWLEVAAEFEEVYQLKDGKRFYPLGRK